MRCKEHDKSEVTCEECNRVFEQNCINEHRYIRAKNFMKLTKHQKIYLAWFEAAEEGINMDCIREDEDVWSIIKDKYETKYWNKSLIERLFNIN